MRILFFGDIVGQYGFDAMSDVLSKLVKALRVDFVIANGENLSRGKGLVYKDYQALMDIGVDVVTLGNHYASKNDILDYIAQAPALIRPANLKRDFPGSGTLIFNVNDVEIQVTNMLGQAFIEEESESPIDAMMDILEKHNARVHIVDYHGESTSEKQIFASYFDGQISAVIGTHTHVQTNDAKILPNGTGFMADAGFSGRVDSILGWDTDSVIDKIVNGNERSRFSIPVDGDKEVDCVYLEIDEETGNTVRIEPIRLINGKEVSYGTHNL